MIKTIFFDFDGVILESVNAKTEAFREMYLDKGEEFADRVVDFHVKNGGMSRFEKFKIWNGEWLGEALDETRINKLASQFSKLSLAKVNQSPYVIGAKEFLESHSSDYNCYVITGSAMDDILQTVDNKKIAHHFKGVYGSPNKKDYWSEHIISENNYSRDEIVFIGDAMADYNAAQSSKLHFIGRNTEDNLDLFESYSFPKIDDLTYLNDEIQKIK